MYECVWYNSHFWTFQFFSILVCNTVWLLRFEGCLKRFRNSLCELAGRTGKISTWDRRRRQAFILFSSALRGIKLHCKHFVGTLCLHFRSRGLTSLGVWPDPVWTAW